MNAQTCFVAIALVLFFNAACAEEEFLVKTMNHEHENLNHFSGVAPVTTAPAVPAAPTPVETIQKCETTCKAPFDKCVSNPTCKGIYEGAAYKGCITTAEKTPATFNAAAGTCASTLIQDADLKGCMSKCFSSSSILSYVSLAIFAILMMFF